MTHSEIRAYLRRMSTRHIMAISLGSAALFWALVALAML